MAALRAGVGIFCPPPVRVLMIFREARTYLPTYLPTYLSISKVGRHILLNYIFSSNISRNSALQFTDTKF